MTLQKIIRALVAGMVFPALFLPIAYSLVFIISPHTFVLLRSLQFVPMYIPILFGVGNIIYVFFSKNKSPKKNNQLLLFVGFCLGLIVALLNIPTFIFGVVLNQQTTAMIVLPILYALVFRYIIKWVNKTLRVR